MSKNVLDNKCPSCGANIKFNPETQTFKCEYCFSEYTLEEMKKFNNASSEEANKKESKNNTSYITYSCENCGAEIIADENTASTFCVYCGSTAILKDKLSGEFAPSLIIPFKKTKEMAVKAFIGLKKGRPLIPKSFISEQNIEKITGVYIPFWLYDVKVKGLLTAKSTFVTSWRSGDYTYTKTDVYSMESDGEMTFQKIPVDGSTRFDNNIMNAIEPFNYEELEPYNHAYLSGFLAEKYDVNKEEAFKDAHDRSHQSATNKMLNDMKAPGVKTIVNNGLEASYINTSYAMLPVFMVNVKYNNQIYPFAMNGQTGEFVGNIPLDKKKAFLYFFIILIAVFCLVILISYIVFLIS